MKNDGENVHSSEKFVCMCFLIAHTHLVKKRDGDGFYFLPITREDDEECGKRPLETCKKNFLRLRSLVSRSSF